MDNSSNEKRTGFIYSLLIPALIASIVSILAGVILVKWAGVNFTELGSFGDFFAGSTVPIFTLVSFIGLIITLRMQKQQLEMQRQELQNSILEMQETRREIKEQGQTMALQRFESTFFNMLSLHNEIIKSLSARDVFNAGALPKTERAVFPYMINFLKRTSDSLVVNNKIQNQPPIVQIRTTYNELFKIYEAQLGHYFRNLYRIVKFVDEAHINDKEKNTYIGIIKAQLSSYELTMLLYNGLSEHGIKFLPLMRKYNLLDNINKELSNISGQDYELYENYSEPVEGKEAVEV
ncbi:putative phage abortive infection protein [Priestia aryabhattai]|uniref:putative phage abortive infection protein n=1 Tax=Priestia aryabhattai TaxID=412384 RepID=UPI00398E37CE